MIVSTVVPRARHNIEVLGQKYFGVTPTFAGECGWPIEIDVDEPASLGADRAVNAIAAHPLGTPLTVHEPSGAALSGSFDGLEPDGALRLRLEDGTARVIHAGDVSLEDT